MTWRGVAEVRAIRTFLPTLGHAHWRLLFLLMAVPNLLLVMVLLSRREPPLPAVLSSSKIFAATLAAFRERLLATIENRKLEQRGGLRLLNGVGFHVLGRTPQGELLIERKLSS